MKLIIQIPCYNEEETLPGVIDDLPHELPGIDEIEYLVIDDGSTDGTVKVARNIGVHHVVSLGSNQGCGAAFLLGIRKCVELGADIIVNTDGDNQYKGRCIKDLIVPIIEGKADIVVGTRPIEKIEHFSWTKKKLQRLGSLVARHFSGTDVPDTTSGFRAYSSGAAMRLHILNRYSHTLETIIQAGHMNMLICHVHIEVNPKTRGSRLMSSMWQYIWHSASIILRSYIRYRPMRTFFYFSLIPGLAGFTICLRFLYFFFITKSSGYVQSLILAAILIIIAFLLIALGILADLTGTNRKLIEEILYFVRRNQMQAQNRKRQDE
ncbi:MAG: glycosyltransferase family 2 protein [Desulfobacterales bacterium]|nr:glycosyltransferase family 2 protein [Desulfobacterales bacterium]